jgi:SAM-dependent methyltransferase
MKNKKKKSALPQLFERIRLLGSLKPLSRVFGGDRGIPIDRYYIEKFLAENSHLIKGHVLEVAGSTYTRKFGGDNVAGASVLHANNDKKNVDIVGNLETGEGIPKNKIDCFILTQTLLCIFDVQTAAQNAIKLLKPGGALLLTVPGITQISRFDYERWGQYWSFTDLSVRKLFEKIVPPANIEVKTYGNVKAASAFLYGLALHEVKKKDLDYTDPDYQMVISAIIKK